MNDRVIAFLPCRKGSERVKKKNTRMFADIEGGLASIKLCQLALCSAIDEIVVSTDDPEVMQIAERTARSANKPIHILERPPNLARSDTSTDDLIKHVPDVIKEGIVLWTHVTSPFVDQTVYEDAVAVYRKHSRKGQNDSLTSVTSIQTFLWDENGPINYDRAKEKWPRTQTLPRFYEVNSAIFIASIDIYRTKIDRIGCSPYFYELSFPRLIDIDTEEQFLFASKVWCYEKENQVMGFEDLLG